MVYRYLKLVFESAVNRLLKLFKTLVLRLASPFNVIVTGIAVLFIAYFCHKFFHVPLRSRLCPATYWSNDLDLGFEGFDNVSGVSKAPYIVPNYVHFLRYGDNLKSVNFMDAVNMLAAFRHQNPDKIFIHTNLEQFSGKYWEKLMKIPGFKNMISFQYIEPLDSIFNQKLGSWYRLWHSSDILRIQILRKFGGIFIDNDVYLVRNMDKFRRFEMTLETPGEKKFGTMTLVAHPDARFLRLWLESYKEYYGHLWYYNAGEKPKLEVLDSRPELAHNVNDMLGVRDLRCHLYVGRWPEWKNQHTIHTMIRHLGDLDCLIHNNLNLVYPVTFTEKNIIHYNVTILDMVLECCKELLE